VYSLSLAAVNDRGDRFENRSLSAIDVYDLEVLSSYARVDSTFVGD
jgi:hypothetical protein